MKGPGSLSLFQTDSFGKIVPATTSTGFALKAGEVIHQEHPAHVHVNWLFEKPGTCTIMIKASGTPLASDRAVLANTVEGSAVESPTETYTFVVGNAAAAPAPAEKPHAEAPAVSAPAGLAGAAVPVAAPSEGVASTTDSGEGASPSNTEGSTAAKAIVGPAAAGEYALADAAGVAAEVAPASAPRIESRLPLTG